MPTELQKLAIRPSENAMTILSGLCYYLIVRLEIPQVNKGHITKAMRQIFSPEYQWLWTIVLGAALFYPVRQFVWVMSVRREERKLGQDTDEARRVALKRRSTVTSVLLCFVFSILYVQVMFRSLFGNQ